VGTLILLANGYRNFCRGVKRPGREVDHSLPPSTEVKNEWSYTFTPPCDIMVWTGTDLVFYMEVGLLSIVGALLTKLTFYPVLQGGNGKLFA